MKAVSGQLLLFSVWFMLYAPFYTLFDRITFYVIGDNAVRSGLCCDTPWYWRMKTGSGGV